MGTFGSSRRASVRRDRLIEEPAVAAGVHESGEKLGSLPWRAASPSNGRPLVPTDHVCFEIGVELVRDREARIEIEGAAKRLLGAGLAVERALDVTPDDAMAPSDLGQAGANRGSRSEALLVSRALC